MKQSNNSNKVPAKKDLNLYNWPGEDQDSKWRHVTDYAAFRDDKDNQNPRMVSLLEINSILFPNSVFILR